MHRQLLSNSMLSSICLNIVVGNVTNSHSHELFGYFLFRGLVFHFLELVLSSLSSLLHAKEAFCGMFHQVPDTHHFTLWVMDIFFHFFNQTFGDQLPLI